MTPVTWVIGQAERAEFRPVLEQLQTLAGARFVACPDISAALGAPEIPDLILILQSHPDEFTRRDFQRLLQHAPIARLVVASGAWCEADGRTRQVWPVAVRVPVSRAVDRLAIEWALLTGEPGRLLPLTATRDECFAAECAAAPPRLDGLLISVQSPDRAWRATQEILITSAGGSIAASPTEAELIWLDGDPWETGGKRLLQQVQAASPRANLVVSLDFPLPELVETVRSLGAQAVLPKLAADASLLGELQGARKPDSGWPAAGASSRSPGPENAGVSACASDLGLPRKV